MRKSKPLVFETKRNIARKKEVLDWEYHYFIPYDHKGMFSPKMSVAKPTNSGAQIGKIKSIKNKLEELLGEEDFYYASNIFSFKTADAALLFRLLW